MVKIKDCPKVEKKVVVKEKFKTHSQEKNGTTLKPQYLSQLKALVKHVLPKPPEQKLLPNKLKAELLNQLLPIWKITSNHQMLGEKSNSSSMMLNLKIVKPVSTEWILLEINYAVWSENGKLWSKPSLIANLLMDIF